MPRRVPHAPSHLSSAPEQASRTGLRRAVALGAVAVMALGLAVTAGVLPQVGSGGSSAASLATAAPSTQSEATLLAARSELAGRERSVSRSASRTRTAAATTLTLRQKSGGQATRTKNITRSDPRSIARAMLADFGFAASEFSCLDALYTSESDWNPNADNPSSSAYGIPQALMSAHDLPADYMTNPATQIRWGLGYVKSTYGTPCGAWAFKQSNGWY